jgi:uncharacterized membrane protein YkvA (DUF1232 family)
VVLGCCVAVRVVAFLACDRRRLKRQPLGRFSPNVAQEITMVDYRIDFYQQMRDKIRGWLEDKGANYKYADYLLAAPDLLHLLCRLTLDGQVPVSEKAKLAAAIAYYISPLDLIPEAITGPVGYIDDVVLGAYVLNGIMNKAGPDIVKRHWAGSGDVLELIRQVLQIAGELVGSGLWKRLKGIVE